MQGRNTNTSKTDLKKGKKGLAGREGAEAKDFFAILNVFKCIKE